MRRFTTSYKSRSATRVTPAFAPVINKVAKAKTIYTGVRNNPATGPYLRRAERYVLNRVRNYAAGLVPKTVLLPKMKFSTATATPGEISYSSFRLGKYMPAYFKTAIKTSQKYIYNESGSAHTKFAIGEQGVNDLYVMDGSRMYNLAQKARAQYGSGPNTNPQNYSVWFGQVKTTIRFANPGLSSISVDIYNYDCRRDLNDYTVSGTPSLAQTWAWGALYESGPSVYNTYRLGASPLDINLSGKFWKIRKKTTIQLPPGSEHIHVVTYQLNRAYNSIMDINVQANDYTAAHAGFTHGVLIVPSGAVAHDQDAPTQVDTVGGALDFVYNTVYDLYTFSGSQPTVEYVDNTGLLTSPQLVVVQNPTLITP